MQLKASEGAGGWISLRGGLQPPATCTYEPGVVDILLEEEGATNDAKASEATNGTDSNAALEAKVAKLRRWQEADAGAIRLGTHAGAACGEEIDAFYARTDTIRFLERCCSRRSAL